MNEPQDNNSLPSSDEKRMKAPAPQPSLAILIVNYNTRHDLQRCLTSLYTHPPLIDFEIIVIDNHSSDGSVEMLHEHFPGVRLRVNETNVGLVKGYNQACRMTDAPYRLLLDSDTMVQPGAVDILLRHLMANPDVGIVAPRLLNIDGTDQQTARNLPTPVNALFGRQTLLTHLFPANPWSRRYLRNQDQHRSDPYQVEWISFACGMFRAELLQQAGYFDEDYFVYWIDADWCKRVLDCGYRIVCVPEARVIHVEKNQKRKKRRPSSILDFHRGVYLFFRKHYAPSPLHPMAWIALIGLSCRAGLHLLLNAFKK